MTYEKKNRKGIYLFVCHLLDCHDDIPAVYYIFQFSEG